MKRAGRHTIEAFDVGVYILLIIVLLIVVYPLYFTIVASVSDPLATANGKTFLLPKGITFKAYQNVIASKSIWTGYRNTIVYTVFGTLFNLALTIPAAYALAKKELPFSRVFVWAFMFTLYFSGGLIPTYIVVKKVGLVNTWYALILLNGVDIFNLIVTRNFYQTSIPNDIYEAAEIDGCSDIGIFTRIALPLSGAIIAVMGLFYAVRHWNGYFTAMIYLSRDELYPLQLVLKNILSSSQNALQTLGLAATDEEIENAVQRAMLAETMKYALIFIASFPVMVAYTFVQKYFVKGIMMGAVKG